MVRVTIFWLRRTERYLRGSAESPWRSMQRGICQSIVSRNRSEAKAATPCSGCRPRRCLLACRFALTAYPHAFVEPAVFCRFEQYEKDLSETRVSWSKAHD